MIGKGPFSRACDFLSWSQVIPYGVKRPPKHSGMLFCPALTTIVEKHMFYVCSFAYNAL